MLTIINAILHYQQRKRYLADQQKQPKVLFPRIGRDDANKNLNAMIKYLFNYVFYKLGIEITFIAMVLLISVRADLVAVAYSLWLILLAVMPRNGKRYIWIFFQAFIVFTTSFQYIVILHLPPSISSSKYSIIKHIAYQNMIFIDQCFF